MKRMFSVLFLSLLMVIGGTSKTISQDSLLTAQDLKKLNLILLEHAKFRQEVPLLNKQIANYKELCKSYEKSDSAYKKSEVIYKDVIKSKDKTIKKLRNSNKIFKGISGASLIAIICLIIL